MTTAGRGPKASPRQATSATSTQKTAARTNRDAMLKIDALIDELDAQLSGMRARHVGAFEACCATRLQPLYGDFHRAAKWGSETDVRRAVDLAWAHLIADDDAMADACSQALERLTDAVPHADDFDMTECTMAQDACICAEAALRRACHSSTSRSPAPDAALEAIRTFVCAEKTGAYDLGDAPEALVFEQRLLADPRFVAELHYQQEDIRTLESTAVLDRRTLEGLRRRAEGHAWTAKRLASGGRT